MPCGVPEQSWPYTESIDAANALRFDPATGKLWVAPKPHYTATATPTWNSVAGRHAVQTDSNGITAYRVWAAALVAPYGPSARFAMTSLVEVAWTNTSGVPVKARAVATFPEVRYYTNYQLTRFGTTIRGYVNNNLVETSGHRAFDALQGSAPAAGGMGYPFNGAAPTTGSVDSALGDAVGTNLDFRAHKIGLFNVRMPKFDVDVFGGWRQVNPGDTVTYGMEMAGATPDPPGLYVVGGLPDIPYLTGFLDVYDLPAMSVEVIPAT